MGCGAAKTVQGSSSCRSSAASSCPVGPPAAVRADLFLHKLIELFQRMVVLLLGAFHQAQPLKLRFDPLHSLVYPGAARFPATIEQKTPFLCTVIPVFFVQIEQA